MRHLSSTASKQGVNGHRRALLSLLFTLLLIITSTVYPVYAQFQPPHQKPGPAVDKIAFKAFAVEIAPVALEDRQMDMYIFALRTSAAREILNKPGVEVYRAPATSVAIVLNPAPAPAGELNPFSIREVRFALQYLVNREFVAGEIYQGQAAPMVTHISPFDFDYLTLYDLIRRFNIHYDPELAKIMVDRAMEKAGAVKEGNRWTYDGRPIRLKFVIRTEDERRDIGDAVASELDKLGFTVDRDYQRFGPAIQKVYGTDPKIFQWHLYTEGWSKGSAQKYDFGTLNQMVAPWFGNMPGWQEVGYHQYENSTLDEISKQIFTGDFKDLQERNSLYRKATEMALEESIRIWVVNIVNSYPADASLEGITNDLASGPRSIWTLREAYLPGKTELTMGSLWVWTERTIWNPVGGFGDVYSVDIWQNVYDPPLWTHPFTGIPVPFRATFEVETAGPTGKLSIPSDAFVWDASAGRWSSVRSGSQATSKVTFDYAKYIGSKWHHGQQITMADILYSIYQTFDLTYNEDKSKIEFATATVNKPYLDTFKGFRIVDETTLEVYLDYWHFIPDYIAQYAQPAGISMPWEVLAAMDNLVFEKRRAAYSDTAAEKFQVPWLSLVMENDARLVRNVLLEFSRSGFLPESVFTVDGRSLVDQDEANRRYDAAASWFDEYKILVISNGPFMLTKFEPQSQYAELNAFRDPTYPFKPGEWYFGSAQLVDISEVEGGPVAVGADARYTVDVTGPGEVGVKYVLFDPVNGEVLMTGDAVEESPNRLAVDISSDVTSKMVTGAPYRLFLAAFSDELSYVTERVEKIDVGTTTTTTKTTPTTTTTQPTTTKTTTGEEPEGAPTTLLIAAIVVVLVVVIVPVLLLRRRGAGRTG
ncbi:MAG: ABC transporter substrate-binding protein [Nitrososphaerales archaeon]